MKTSALLVYVNDVQQGLDWYSKVFPSSKAISLDEGLPTALLFDGILLELAKADEKVGSGNFGTSSSSKNVLQSGLSPGEATNH